MRFHLTEFYSTFVLNFNISNSIGLQFQADEYKYQHSSKPLTLSTTNNSLQLTKSIKKIILIGASVLILVIGMYYFGFIYAFRNYGEMGGDYPLATYTFQVGLNKTKTQLDSVCKAKQFSFTTTFDTTGAFPDYYSIVINHKQDSLAFQIWLKPVLRDSVTELYLLQVEDKNRSVSYQSTKANDKAFVLRLRSKLEKELLSEMKGIH